MKPFNALDVVVAQSNCFESWKFYVVDFLLNFWVSVVPFFNIYYTGIKFLNFPFSNETTKFFHFIFVPLPIKNPHILIDSGERNRRIKYFFFESDQSNLVLFHLIKIGILISQDKIKLLISPILVLQNSESEFIIRNNQLKIIYPWIL